MGVGWVLSFTAWALYFFSSFFSNCLSSVTSLLPSWCSRCSFLFTVSPRAFFPQPPREGNTNYFFTFFILIFHWRWRTIHIYNTSKSFLSLLLSETYCQPLSSVPCFLYLPQETALLSQCFVPACSFGVIWWSRSMVATSQATSTSGGISPNLILETHLPRPPGRSTTLLVLSGVSEWHLAVITFWMRTCTFQKF